MDSSRLNALYSIINSCDMRLYSDHSTLNYNNDEDNFHNPDNVMLLHEFEEVQVGSNISNFHLTASVGLSPENWLKNRYKDIVPYDFNRVHLLNKFTNGSDYINASHIQLDEDKYYIASQGPTSRTSGEFLQMIWEQTVEVIVCAVNEVEDEKNKCIRYWPNNVHEEYRTKRFIIQLGKEPAEMRCEGNFLVRILKLICIKTNQFRYITHYHFIHWPDHSVPESTFPVMQLISSVKLHNSKGPILVHCSAGCGRTGTIIAISHCMNIIQNGSVNAITTINIPEIVVCLRKQRVSMVQTLSQFRFIYKAVVDLINSMIYQQPNQKASIASNVFTIPIRRNRSMTTSTSNPAYMHTDEMNTQQAPKLFLTSSRISADKLWKTDTKELSATDKSKFSLFRRFNNLSQLGSKNHLNKAWNTFSNRSAPIGVKKNTHS